MIQKEARDIYFRLKCFGSHFESFFKSLEDADSNLINSSKQLFQSVESITLGECVGFVSDEKPFKNFPHCKTFSQIFDDYICDAIEFCSSYLLRKKLIDANAHKENLVFLHVIHKFEIKVLDVLFEEVNADCAVDVEDEENEEDEESHNVDKGKKISLTNNIYVGFHSSFPIRVFSTDLALTL